MSRRLPVADGFGRLLAATLCLMREAPDDPRLSYYAAACPPHHFCEHMAWWREGGEAARVAANSVSYRRVARMRREVVEEGTAFAEAGFKFTPPPPWDSLIPQGGDMFLWVKLLLQTRAVETDQGHVLPPCVCLANHRSVGESAKVCVADGEVRLVATVALGVDDEVSINYDPEADYLDLYERYGFWDESAVVHTAEVVVPPAELEALLREAEAADEGGAEGAPPPSAIRRELVAAQAEAGSDPTLQAWWLPDHLAEAAPLLAALRATVLTPSESAQYARDLAAGEAGREAAARRLRSAAVQNEDAARARMARLVRAHLAGFENGAAGGASPHDAAGSFEPEAAVAAELTTMSASDAEAYLSSDAVREQLSAAFVDDATLFALGF